MKEREYINVRDLSQVLAAEQHLKQITIANSIQALDREDYYSMMNILSRWRDALFAQIHDDSEK